MGLQLDLLADEFRAVSDRARALVARVGVARLTERPATGGWNIAECLEHLNMTTRAFLPRWREALSNAPKSDGPYRTDLWGKLLVWVLEPPSRFRMPTTPAFQQIQTPPPDQVLPAFLACQDDLLTVLASARGLAIDRVKVRSPFQEKMQYSVWSSFRISAAHHRRHLWQAERVLS
jgi:DinB superfamily